MTTLTVGIIGCNGRIGRLHTENLASRLPECKLKSICDAKIDEAQALALRWGIPTVTINYQEIIHDPEINAVVICTPTPTHVSYITEAAQAGKHVFCEKPVDLSPQRIVDAIVATRKNRVRLQVGFMKRFDPEYSKLKELMCKGAVGEPHIIRITSRDSTLPSPEYVTSSGGLFHDMTCHDFDLLRYLTESEVDDVFAMGNVRLAEYFRKARDYDTAVISFRLQDGTLGCIDNSRKTNYGYDQRVELFGSHGCVMADHVKRSNVVTLNESGMITDKPKDWFMDRYAQAYLEEMRQFMEAVRADREPRATAMDGLKALLISLAARKSIDENRPVKVDYGLCAEYHL